MFLDEHLANKINVNGFEVVLPKKSMLNGLKESDNKLNIEYDWEFLKLQMERMGRNKSKYPKYNWKKPINIQELKDALFRHVIEVMDGNYDDDSEKHGHLSAISLNSMMIFYQLNNIKL